MTCRNDSPPLLAARRQTAFQKFPEFLSDEIGQLVAVSRERCESHARSKAAAEGADSAPSTFCKERHVSKRAAYRAAGYAQNVLH